MSLPGRIEDSFERQLDGLPHDTRRLLAMAAADPSGDPLLVWRAADRLGIPAGAAVPAAEAGLAEFGARVRFRHPLVRSAAYRSAPLGEQPWSCWWWPRPARSTRCAPPRRPGCAA